MGDQFSGPRVFSGPAADITDFYVFPSPDRPGHVVLIFSAFPGAAATALFSGAIIYRFQLRPLTLVRTGAAPGFTVANDEHTFDCTPTAPCAGLRSDERECREVGTVSRRIARQ